MPKYKKEEAEGSLDLENFSVEEAIEALNKKYGANTLVIPGQIAKDDAELSFISSGSAALDIALGGGFPEKRMTEIRGPYSSFKSTIATIAGRNHQQKYEDGWVLWVDAEHAFDFAYAKRLGLDLNRVMLCNPDSGEQAVDAMNDLLRLPVPIFGVIDSIAALIPSAELDARMDQQFMGLQARLVARAMRILTGRMKRGLYNKDSSPTTVLALNQIRMKIGVLFGNPETSPGGLAREHAYSVIVRLHASVAKANIIVEEETRNTITRPVRYGQRIDFKVFKNKCGGPQHEEGDFLFYERAYKGNEPLSFNNAEALFNYGAFFDIITWSEKGGFEFQWIKGTESGHDLRFKKPVAFVEALKNRPKHCSVLFKRILVKVRRGNAN